MKKEKYEVELIKEPKKEFKKDTDNLVVYKSGFWSSYSGLIIFLLFATICYLSVVKSNYFVWLLFGIVSLPILRRNFNDVSVIILGLALIVCATTGILVNGVTDMNLSGHEISKAMAMGIAILGLFYISIITFYRKLKFIDSMNTILFYLIVLITAYPIFIICVFVGSLLGYLGVTMLKILIYCLLALPIILALYLIFNKGKKVIKTN